MGDKHDSYVTAWTSAQERELLQKGWTQVGTVHIHGKPAWRPILAPPEPKAPTLAERLRSEIAYGINSQLADDAADALEHYERVEAIARKVVVEPNGIGRHVLVSVELLWELADALNEGKKAPGADSL